MVNVLQERRRLRERFPSLALGVSDMDQCSNALTNYEELLSNKDICEGNCSRGQSCPTGGVAFYIDFQTENWEK